MNADEIVRALRHTCDGCNPTPCCEFEALGPEAADMIESLQAQLAASQRRERAAVEDLNLSNTRKFNNPCEICRKRGEKCAPVDLQDVCRLWEWRGPQEAGEVNQDG